MSEEGWKAFLGSEGVGDWVVLHGGATAFFRVASLGDAARLAGAIAAVPGLEESSALLTLSPNFAVSHVMRSTSSSRAERPALGWLARFTTVFAEAIVRKVRTTASRSISGLHSST